jgi:RNA polymerase sigma-70 factor (ECF subfamily)
MKAVMSIPMEGEEKASMASNASMTSDEFEAWMMAEQRRITLLCLRILRNSDEADSAAQDVFVKAFREMSRAGGSVIREPAKWLTKVAVNACMDRLNSGRWMFWKRRVEGADGDMLLQAAPAAGLNQEEWLIQREKARKLTQALDKLSPRQRLIFVMRHDEERSYDEIASLLNIDLGTVKSHMARAVSKLRAELRDVYAR